MSLVCVLSFVCVLAVNQPWIQYTILGAAGGASMVSSFIKLWCRSAGNLPSFNFHRQEMVNSTVPGVAASLVRRKPGKLFDLCPLWSSKENLLPLQNMKSWNACHDSYPTVLTVLGYNVEEVPILSSHGHVWGVSCTPSSMDVYPLWIAAALMSVWWTHAAPRFSDTASQPAPRKVPPRKAQ